MLIQITNRCYQNCPHCMQDSDLRGEHMDFHTLKQTLKFGDFLGCSVYLISGGEPTEHPEFLDFCKYIEHHIGKTKKRAYFAVLSNGTWFPAKSSMIEDLSKLKHYINMQVYTNKKWYADADFILRHKEEICKIPKVIVDTADIRNMQPLGRAKGCEDAMKEVNSNRYHMSCLNTHLLFRQISPSQKLKGLESSGLVCKPMVDFKGNVHASESWLCPSFGNVNTDYMLTIFNNLKASQPFYGCVLGKKFLESNDLNIIRARRLLSNQN